MVSNGGSAAAALALSSGAAIDETSISYAGVTSASLNPRTDVLTVYSGGVTHAVQLSGNLQGASLGLSSDGSGGTEIVNLGVSPQVTGPVSPATTRQQTVILAGSNLQFVNTYTSNVSTGYQDAIVTAENFYQSQIANTATLNFNFDTAPGVGAGTNSYSTVSASFSQLETALSNLATSADDRAAVAAISALAGHFAGSTFEIADPLAQVLGLPGATAGTIDTTQLDSTLSYFYNQSSPTPNALDAVAILEHEISEGAFGRLGGDGSTNGIMDLFRYAGAGVLDTSLGRDGRAAYLSIDGTQLLTQFHNPFSPGVPSDGGDSADWDASGTNQQPTYIAGQSNAYDAYGVTTDGAIGMVTSTDLRVLDVLGWTLAAMGPIKPATSDFNGNGLSDLVWRNANGDAGIWLTTADGGYTPVDFGVIDTNW
ncbi:MAG: Ca2+-binding protein toxin, partial [Caulobacteraceae bacterium]|nr:Ca2+-binding protein toxin [Caulobacteraceae bacterium]